MALAEKLEQLPSRPGVYLFKGADGAILYVGKARVLRDRVRSYFQASRPTELHKTRMVEEIADLDLVVTDSEMEALALENNLIKRHKPPYNLRLRDDKNHPYLKLTLAEEYPRLYVVRRPSEDGNAYGGPYIPASLGRKTAGLVRKLFGIRSCKETLDGKRPRPCLQYQIKRCMAPCVAEICSPRPLPPLVRGRAALPGGPHRGGGEAPPRADGRGGGRGAVRGGGLACATRSGPSLRHGGPAEDHHHRHRGARPLRRPRGGRAGGGAGLLASATGRWWPGRASSSTASPSPSRCSPRPSSSSTPRAATCPARCSCRARSPDRELLEQWLSARTGTLVHIHVPQRGEKLRLLELVVRNARLAFELEWKHPRKQSQEILRALRDLLDLEVEPRRIECFDISNIQGSDIVASMVVFEAGLPKKSDYRKFRVKSVSGAPDDFASMREVVGRRYKRLLEEGKDLPDLVLIDGGKGQLGAAVAALEELGLGDQPVASLAKREELIFVRGRDEPIALPRSSPVLQLVQRVRDEAHRFAIGFHRQARSQPDAPVGAGRRPGDRPREAAEAALGLRLRPRRPRRDRGRARGRGGQGHGGAPARPLRRGGEDGLGGRPA